MSAHRVMWGTLEFGPSRCSVLRTWTGPLSARTASSVWRFAVRSSRKHVVTQITPAQTDATRRAQAQAVLPDLRICLFDRLMQYKAIRPDIQRQIEPVIMQYLTAVGPELAKRMFLRFN